LYFCAFLFLTYELNFIDVLIENHTLYFRKRAQSKCGTLDYIHYVPGRSDKKVYWWCSVSVTALSIIMTYPVMIKTCLQLLHPNYIYLSGSEGLLETCYLFHQGSLEVVSFNSWQRKTVLNFSVLPYFI